MGSLNCAAETLLELSKNEAVGWPIGSLIAAGADSFDGDASDTIGEGVGRRKDRIEFPIEISHATWIDAEMRTASGSILRGITRRHDAETRRRERDAAERRQEKLAMLGQMAGRISHEINKLL